MNLDFYYLPLLPPFLKELLLSVFTMLENGVKEVNKHAKYGRISCDVQLSILCQNRVMKFKLFHPVTPC
jgi:hypothetical protein